MRWYAYVGPASIREAVAGEPKGALIRSRSDLDEWLTAGQTADEYGQVAVTFTVDGAGLRVADRHSEHVACAGGGPVLTAGEIFFEHDGGAWHVAQVSNQSTGFCPEPESWPAAQDALVKAGISHPGHFTNEIVFRLCPECGERSIVRDAWFVCALCDAELPTHWNFLDASS